MLTGWLCLVVKSENMFYDDFYCDCQKYFQPITFINKFRVSSSYQRLPKGNDKRDLDRNFVIYKNMEYYLSAVGVGLISILVLLRIYLKSTWICFDENVDLTGKTVIVTGANGGLGKCLATELAKRNARVILACRSAARAEAARRDILAASGRSEQQVLVKLLDLSSLDSVREFANQVVNTEERLDILVNNACISGYDVTKTKDNLEMTYQTNHFGPFLLTLLLLDLLKQSGPGSRIVNVGSFSNTMASLHLDYVDPDSVELFFSKKMQKSRIKIKAKVKLYHNSKLMNIMFTFELARRLEESGITVNCVQPGIVRTPLIASDKRPSVLFFMMFMLILSKSIDEGVQPLLHCALSRSLEKVSGKFLSNGKSEKKYHVMANDKEACLKLWQISEKATGISFGSVPKIEN